MAIASLTIDRAKMQRGDLKAATTQIAIELYAPLPGGLALGGRFAPSTVKVQGLVDVPPTKPPTKDPREHLDDLLPQILAGVTLDVPSESAIRNPQYDPRLCRGR